MFVIINLDGLGKPMGLLLDQINPDNGPAIHDTRELAQEHARDNCAWEYQIVEII